jgi:putative phosphoribosyl transferase
MRRFTDRREAGQRLATRLAGWRDEQPIVLGLPRGGVAVAVQVARELRAPGDVIVVRKLGLPYQPELAMGAVGEDGALVLNHEVLRASGVGRRDLAVIEARERAEVQRRAAQFRGAKPMIRLDGRTVIIVDDGIATGSTARAAIQVARAHGAARVILAVPVAPADTVQQLAADADTVIALETPEPFWGVGQWYRDFAQVSDAEVRSLLASMAAPAATPMDQGANPGVRERTVELPADGVVLSGELGVPPQPVGLVVFAHGSGSSRHSPRNRLVASRLRAGGLATLLLDLLALSEEQHRANVFDVALLGDRLAAVTDRLGQVPEVSALPVGYFGASTGAAAALWAAAEPASPVEAIVSRGGRPDLAGPRLGMTRAPTLLIVGGADHPVLELNRDAARQLRCEHDLRVVAGATHLFEEPGALETVADLACRWFVGHLAPSARSIA